MFICLECLDKYDGPSIPYAKMTVEYGRGSVGPCEVCRKTNVCADIPSSANFWLKENK